MTLDRSASRAFQDLTDCKDLQDRVACAENVGTGEGRALPVKMGLRVSPVCPDSKVLRAPVASPAKTARWGFRATKACLGLLVSTVLLGRGVPQARKVCRVP